MKFFDRGLPVSARDKIESNHRKPGQICPLRIISSVLFSLLPGTPAFAAPPAPYGPLPTAAPLAWHEVEFYAIIHLSLNTYTGQEWGYGNESVTLFNPSNFNARAIADVCK